MSDSARPAPLVHVETVQNPQRYSARQREDFIWVAYCVQELRGKPCRFVYALPPDTSDG